MGILNWLLRPTIEALPSRHMTSYVPVKVGGVRGWARIDDLVASYQKNAYADGRMREAAELMKNAKKGK